MQEGTVYVIDDDEAVRKSLDMLFASVGMRVQTFSSAGQFLEHYRDSTPGCLVLDVRMPGMSGLELQRHLKDQRIELPIIIITGHGDVPIAVRAMKDGAVEFLEKPFSKQLLLEHVRFSLERDLARRRKQDRSTEIQARIATLTEREREVMDLVVAGKLSKQVALELGIAKKTVDVHRGRVMQKMQVDSLPELVELVLTARSPNMGAGPVEAPSPTSHA